MNQSAMDHYEVGKLGAYFCPTVEHVDTHLRMLVKRIAAPSSKPGDLDRARADLDLLLDKRGQMTAAVPA